MEIFAVVVLFPNFVISQFTITTIPDTDSGPAYVFANEGTENISLYCEVINNLGNLQLTNWFITRQTDSNVVEPAFFLNGTVDTPEDLKGKITAIGEPLTGLPLQFQNNFTIINFTSEFDLCQLQCGPQGSLRIFILGFTGK